MTPGNAITPGNAMTPGAAFTPLTAMTPAVATTPTPAVTPSAVFTPAPAQTLGAGMPTPGDPQGRPPYGQQSTSGSMIAATPGISLTPSSAHTPGMEDSASGSSRQTNIAATPGFVMEEMTPSGPMPGTPVGPGENDAGVGSADGLAMAESITLMPNVVVRIVSEDNSLGVIQTVDNSSRTLKVIRLEGDGAKLRVHPEASARTVSLDTVRPVRPGKRDDVIILSGKELGQKGQLITVETMVEGKEDAIIKLSNKDDYTIKDLSIVGKLFSL